MRNSAIILLFFILGVCLGEENVIPESMMTMDLPTYVLYVLMLLVGVGVGADWKAFTILKKHKFGILLVPFSIVIGSLIGGGVVKLFFSDMLWKDALSVVSGLGYYSLSSLFITDIRGEELGAIALMSNIFRELITLLFTPFFVWLFGCLGGIASGGATAMDTTLPVIAKYSGKEWVVVAVFSGIVLTLLVPFLVTFILQVF